MSEASTHYARTWKKPHFIKSSLLRYSIYLGTITYFFLAVYTMDVNWTRVAEGIPRGMEMIGKFFPPDLSDSRGVILDGILESIWMAIISTIGGILLSVPIGLGAARNLAPTWIYLFCRSIIAVSRTFQR
jgi:phosphonate transport system permease protein